MLFRRQNNLARVSSVISDLDRGVAKSGQGTGLINRDSQVQILSPQNSRQNSKAVGERSEGLILGLLLRLGKVVLMPFGNNQRYDLVVDNGDGTFTRGQCKTAIYYKGCVVFSSSSINGFTKKRRCYVGQIEVFWVYCPQLDTTYEVPVDKAARAQTWLRVDAAKNSQVSKINWARNFLLA